ncbi:hypothetical protein PTE30175_03532 [Pandoraea terrae]|uniref:Uncharacterized protein n=1 Tax=Pandoraea terrae TaxID=1537710 RepID=A0A5E4X2X3_9BURK|nr:hypothetical protein [Pandoraea terrae]VVE30588.1 hypothetical protein PTE30175_03532 [Pandoraea terrae]
MTKHSMETGLDAVTSTLADECAQDLAVETRLDDAIEDALSLPFSVIDGARTPFAAMGDPNGQWEWAVFSNFAPGKTERATMRSLFKKLHAARELDESSFFEGRFLTPFDLSKRSGIWPDASVDGVVAEDGYASATVRYRFVLCSKTDAVGFCTLTSNLGYYGGGSAPEAEIEVGSVFVEPKCRGIGLSDLLAEAAAYVVVNMLREFHERLIELGTTELCELQVCFTGDPISFRGERFLEAAAANFEQQWYAFLDTASERVSVEITEISARHE